MKYFILTGLFFTLTQFVYSETLTMIHYDFPKKNVIELLSDDPVRKKFNSSSLRSLPENGRLEATAAESDVKKQELAKECWGELIGGYSDLSSVLVKLYELGYKPRSVSSFEATGRTLLDEMASYKYNVHTFIFEKN
jgi:hypothetical protein